MQDKKWLRVGLATLLVSGGIGGMSAAGCSGDDNTTPAKDAGNDHSVVDGSSGGPDSPTGDSHPVDSPTGDGEGGTTKPNAKVFLVHAAVDPNAPPLRFCFGLAAGPDGGTVTVAGGIDPFPDSKIAPNAPVAGLLPGFGGSTSSSPQLAAFDLSTLNIALYAVNAISIANDTADGGPDGGAEVPCEGLIGSDGLGKGGAGGGTLTAGTDYWPVGLIPQGTLAHGTTWLAAVEGCAPGETGANAALCGSGYSATTGNLHLVAYKLDSTTAVDGGIGAQFAQTSPQWDGVLGQAGSVATVAGFFVPYTPPADAGSQDGASDAEAGPPPPALTFLPITQTAKDDGNLYPTTLATVPGIAEDSGTTGFFAQGVTSGGATVLFPPGCDPLVLCYSPELWPLGYIDLFSNGTITNEFANGKGFVFVQIGDPTELPFIGADGGPTDVPPDPNNPVPNFKAPHVLAFPTANP
jgi:hypothetical protein